MAKAEGGRLTTHVLDTASGKPAAGLKIALYRVSGNSHRLLKTVETNADGSIDIYFGPTAPEGKEHNWLQTVPGKGWWMLLRLYSPEATFFDKTWRPPEVEPI